MNRLKAFLKFLWKLPIDKKSHFAWCAILAVIGSVIYPRGGGLILAMGIGIYKEILDNKKNKAVLIDTIGDLYADLLGSIFGTVLFYVSIFSAHYIWNLV